MMAFPVDMLNTYSHEELERSAVRYLSDLRYGDPHCPEFLALPDHSKVRTSKYLSPCFLDTLVNLKRLEITGS